MHSSQVTWRGPRFWSCRHGERSSFYRDILRGRHDYRHRTLQVHDQRQERIHV